MRDAGRNFDVKAGFEVGKISLGQGLVKSLRIRRSSDIELKSDCACLKQTRFLSGFESGGSLARSFNIDKMELQHVTTARARYLPIKGNVMAKARRGHFSASQKRNQPTSQ